MAGIPEKIKADITIVCGNVARQNVAEALRLENLRRSGPRCGILRQGERVR